MPDVNYGVSFQPAEPAELAFPGSIFLGAHTLAEKLRERTDVVIEDSSPWHHVLWNALGGDKSTEVEPEVHRVMLTEFRSSPPSPPSSLFRVRFS